MEQGFVDILKKLIDEQGKEALLDPKIFDKYINDGNNTLKYTRKIFF